MRQVSVVLALAAGIGLHQATTSAVGAQTIQFDESARSPGVIHYDPTESFEVHNAYITGRIPTNVQGPLVDGTDINMLLGADTFYSHGYTGTNAAIANIEAGHIWNGHETLTHAQQIINHPSALNEFDRHATWVSAVLAGRRSGPNPGPYQEGLAPAAELYSGAIATQFNGPRPAGNFSSTFGLLFDQYRKAFSTGMNAGGRTADVINSSWGNSDGANGSDTYAIGLDGFANANPRTLFVVAAGNSGPGPDRVWSPASGYNNMSVAALGPNPPYDRPAWFSSGGPNDYTDPVNGTVNNARQVVDIAAPGENLAAAYYGGETGGNGTTDNPSVSGPGPTGLPYGSLGGPDYYTRGALGGTSLAAPTVAGGAALLYDAAYSAFAGNQDARDARVMKAVLMNSADKTMGWDNGQTAHPNGNGGVLTTQGLDNRVGTGGMNLQAAFEQYLTGTTDVPGTASGDLGLIEDYGWDLGQVAGQATNDYYFNAPLLGGSTLTATLDWFRDRQISTSNSVLDDSYDDLNLELWSVVSGVPTALVSESSSRFNGSEHFSFELPASGDYALRVRWFGELFDRINDPDQELYGLAWSAAYQDPGDFDRDGDYDCADIDELVTEIVAGTHDRPFDLTGDHLVNVADRDAWLGAAGAANLASGNPYLLGDANLDGSVDGSDFGTWNANKFTSVAAWCSGDFSADGFVDGSDFGIWNANKFQSSLNVVPEPASLLLPLLAWAFFRAKRV